MKLKIFFTSITLCFASLLFAQDNFQGVATYMSKTTVDIDGWGGKEMSPERKKMIMERMKNMLEKTYILTFSKTESMYVEDEKLEAPGGARGMMRMGMSSGSQYKNLKEGLMLQDQEFFGKQFLIKDNLEALQWKMTEETKQIGKYMCMKAVAMKAVDKTTLTKIRRIDSKGGKSKEGEQIKNSTTVIEKEGKTTTDIKDVEIPKEEEVVAWYTMQIPVNNGPSDFWGLPGLILEINSGRTTILCSKIVMNPAEKKEIKQPTKGKQVTKAEYKEIVTAKMKEMRGMYGGKRGVRVFHGGK